jgi:short-subunit dehydrogenase
MVAALCIVTPGLIPEIPIREAWAFVSGCREKPGNESPTDRTMSIARPIALITGASAGIGEALAHEFAARGHEVALVARRGAELSAIADAIAKAGHTRPHVIALDLAQTGAGTQLAQELSARGVEPEIVVNNAGFGLVGAADALPVDAQLAIIDLNAKALTDLSLRWVESLSRHRGGILNVASIASFLPGPYLAVYHATKAYVLSFSEALRIELAPRGVRVTALCPGPVETDFQSRAHMPADYFPRLLVRSPARVAREGYEGLKANRRVVAPGFFNRLITLAAYRPLRQVFARSQARRHRERFKQSDATDHTPT